MKTLVIYYSYTGKTMQLAQQLAEEKGTELCQVQDKRRRSMLGTFFQVPAAMQQKAGKILPIKADLTAFDDFIVMGPIWAGHPAPPVNSILDALPKGAKVALHLVSSSGESNKEKVLERAKAAGLDVTGYVDVKAAADEKAG